MGEGLAVSPATVHVLYGIVGAVFRAALRDRIVPSSPCEQTKLPRKVKTLVVPLGVEAVAGLASALPQRYRAMVVLCAGTGLRQDEAFGLTQDRVNFLKRSLTVDRQLIGQDDGRPRFGPSKTAASVRTVPLPDVVAEALAEHLRVFGTGPDGLLLVDDDELPLLRPRFFRHVWRPAVAAVGAVPHGTGMHDLRHFYASLLKMRGAASDATFGKICERLMPATSPFAADEGRLVEASSHAS